MVPSGRAVLVSPGSDNLIRGGVATPSAGTISLFPRDTPEIDR